MAWLYATSLLHRAEEETWALVIALAFMVAAVSVAVAVFRRSRRRLQRLARLRERVPAWQSHVVTVLSSADAQKVLAVAAELGLPVRALDLSGCTHRDHVRAVADTVVKLPSINDPVARLLHAGFAQNRRAAERAELLVLHGTEALMAGDPEWLARLGAETVLASLQWGRPVLVCCTAARLEQVAHEPPGLRPAQNSRHALS
jgi:hypothetical protein